jgi:hypothetical protein
MGSLILSSKEESLLNQQYKVHLQRLLRLHQATPDPVVFFLAGCLPLQAQLHLRMFSLFGQLCRLREGDNFLVEHAMQVYSSASASCKSWFWKLRQLCLQYGLPHPVTWIASQPSKIQVKTMARNAVLEYWHARLVAKADSLESLSHLRTRCLSLTSCHPIFLSCGSSPWETEKATTQARLLSGRYRLEVLTSHWTPWNRDGLCSLPECWGTDASHKGSVEAFLLGCPSLSVVRTELTESVLKFYRDYPDLENLVKECMSLSAVQFLLDCSTMAPVISAVQEYGDSVLLHLFKLTRNYCHRLHVTRSKLLPNYN